jgi:hypothetical protein
LGRVDCSRPFALQGTRPGYVTELYRALTVPIDKPPPAPVGTAPTPHTRAGDLRLEPASCEFDAEVALQFEAASQGRDVEEQGQAAAERAASAPPSRRSEEEGQGPPPARPSRSVLKEEGTVPPMPAGAFVKEEELLPPMPPGGFFKEEAVVKREHEVVVDGGGRSDGRPKRRRDT